jgi:hypothetical protein
VAVTDLADCIVTVQVVPETESHPVQPMKRKLGVAVRVTTVLLVKDSEQSVPQLIPDGLELTLPLMRPVVLTVRTKRGTSKVAVTARAASMVTVHAVPETVSHPLQPAKVDPLAALAVRVTLVPLS